MEVYNEGGRAVIIMGTFCPAAGRLCRAINIHRTIIRAGALLARNRHHMTMQQSQESDESLPVYPSSSQWH